MKHTLLLLLFFSASFLLKAQENILINTNTTQIVLKVDTKQNVTFEHYGKKLNAIDDLYNANANMGKDAFPSFGIYPYRLMALRAKHANADQTVVLKYQSHKQTIIDENVELTSVLLKDENYPFYVELKYKTFNKEDVIEIWSEIYHDEKKGVTLYDYASAYLAFKTNTSILSHFHGTWGDEFMMEETEVTRGTLTIENKGGIRNTQADNPSFFLSLNSKPAEDNGEVIAGSLAWTGNYKITFERDYSSLLHLTAGINTYASEYILEKGKRFITPELILTYSNEGKGKASRNLHRYARNYKMIGGNEERKILLNSWEGVYFKFGEKDIVDMIDDFSKIGGELFVLDDGWFGNKYMRNSGTQGLGDWQVAETKLPSGIDFLIDESENRNMKFGIWVEPEMANVTSELYEKHPDWILQNRDRELIKGRGATQVVLDLTNPKVQDFVFNIVNDLLVKHPRINYIKWDANASITNYGSTYLSAEKQSHIYIDYHLGLQSVLKRLRAAHPTITMQACASGGGRVSYGYLPYFHEFWTSDNTDALKRIYIQWGMSHVFPAITIASHVSASPNHQSKRQIPIKFRFDVAMTGRLGMEMQPKDMTDKEKEFSKAAIETYKGIRPIVQFGDLYRILSPFENRRLASLMYVDEQKQNAVFFAYYLEKRVGESSHPAFRFKGLDADTRYKVVEINKENDKGHFAGEGKTYSGSFLMNVGLKLNIMDEYDSVVLKLSAE
jgi:alpha-galactosidase